MLLQMNKQDIKKLSQDHTVIYFIKVFTDEVKVRVTETRVAFSLLRNY